MVELIRSPCWRLSLFSSRRSARIVGDHIFKYLAPREAGLLERALPHDLVFVQAGAGEALLRSVAGRRHAEAAKAGAGVATLVPLGEGREGRVTWTAELLWIQVAVARLRLGRVSPNHISAAHKHSLRCGALDVGRMASWGTEPRITSWCRV